MYPLIGCSLISLTLIVERCIFWIIHHRSREPKCIQHALELLRENQLDRFYKRCQNKPDFILKLYCKAIQFPHNIKSALDIQTTQEFRRMTKYHSILETIITLSPMIGILGTIMGIIISFKFLSTSSIQDPKLVTIGISQALITTAFGLTIAIITLIPFNFFNSQVSRAKKLMEIYLSELELILSQSEFKLDRLPESTLSKEKLTKIQDI